MRRRRNKEKGDCKEYCACSDMRSRRIFRDLVSVDMRTETGKGDCSEEI